MKIYPFFLAVITIVFSFPCFAVDTINHPTPVFSQQFSSVGALSSWTSNNLIVTKENDYIKIAASGNDSKLWRRINLPRGRYRLTVTSASDIRVKITADSWTISGKNIYLNDYRTGLDFKNYSVDFDFPGGTALLIIQAQNNIPSRIKALNIKPAFEYTFVDKHRNYLEGNWLATDNMGLVSGSASLEITAQNLDSKIYRNDLVLEPRSYSISAIGRNVNIELRSGWGDEDLLAVLTLGNGSMDIRTSEFTIPSRGNYYLIAKVRGDINTKGYIKGISVKPLLNYTFYTKGSSSKDWFPSGVSMKKLPGSLVVTASSNPAGGSKIERAISLPPDEYIVTVSAKGNTRLRLNSSSSTNFIDEIVSFFGEEWVTKSYYYRSYNSDPITLALLVNGKVGDSAEIKRIRVERAPITYYPDPGGLRGWMQTFGQSSSNWSDLANTGANIVRLQHKPANRAVELEEMGRIVDGSNIFDPIVFDAILDDLENSVRLAQQHNLKVVIDLHQAPFNIADRIDQRTNSFWNHPNVIRNFRHYWVGVAKRMQPYRDTVIGYDLFNEPLNNANQPRIEYKWRDIAQQIVNSIRRVDQETWIVYEPGAGAVDNAMDYTKPLSDHKVIYSRHIYDSFDYTHQGRDESFEQLPQPPLISYPSSSWNKDNIEHTLRSSDIFQAKYQVPVFIGEIGVVKWAGGAEKWLHDVIAIMEDRGWSWTAHAWRQWQGWNYELNSSFFTVGDDISQHLLGGGELSPRLEAIKAGLRRNR